jgi:cysteine desulfurase
MICYFDNAATTKPHPLVVEEMIDILQHNFGNASSGHKKGTKAKEKIEIAQSKIANLIGCKHHNIFFTSGGTESNNWAIYHGINQAQKKKIVTSTVEHHSVINAAKNFELNIGSKVIFVGVDREGVVNLEQLKSELNSNVGLVSVMLVNNELGTIQPVRDISELAKKNDVLFHVDAVQAIGKIPVDVNDLGVDMMSVSSHKFHGPQGVGALFVRDNIDIVPLISGGSQQKEKRGGTYNLPGIVGMGKAAELVNTRINSVQIQKNTNLLKDLLSDIEGCFFNTPNQGSVPGILNVGFVGLEAKPFLSYLSERGIYCSSGSACSEGKTSVSHVLKAIGLNNYKSHSSIRFSLSNENTPAEIEYAVRIIRDSINRYREGF